MQKEELSPVEKIYGVTPELNDRIFKVITKVTELNKEIRELKLPIWVSAETIKGGMKHFTESQQEYISRICKSIMHDVKIFNLGY